MIDELAAVLNATHLMCEKTTNSAIAKIMKMGQFCDKLCLRMFDCKYFQINCYAFNKRNNEVLLSYYIFMVFRRKVV